MRSRPPGFWRRSESMLTLLIALLFLCQGVQAAEAWACDTVLFDSSEPPPLPNWILGDHLDNQLDNHLDNQLDNHLANHLANHLDRREDATSLASPTASGNLQVATQTAMAALPTPFDSSLGNNFTSSTCPTFFQNFLHAQAFRDCLPLSLLLQTSNGFFEASRSLLSVTQTLDATCNVNFGQCSALMSTLAQQVLLPTTCGEDLQMLNPLVTQARNGFLAYASLYHAGCLTDSDGNYCYANAVTNVSAPTSSYIYYLPLGVQLPGGARPACNECLRNTMAIFADQAANSSQPLSKDYTSAAQQVQMNCGPTFVETVAQHVGAASLPSSPGLYLTLPVMLLAYLI
ncbi:Hypothetical predicted protein [Lecanosticta acicola]|uniref:DUF7729 domain-containing protein n=1 Tax=Lecanosticta acicola TaxID=111012 RepID=A0AAI9E8H4_9PEZI|nr:Hypothetical predicted protein [Lecanosticta acicola]